MSRNFRVIKKNYNDCLLLSPKILKTCNFEEKKDNEIINSVLIIIFLYQFQNLQQKF